MKFTPLDFDLYDSFNIPNGYVAYELTLSKTTEIRASEIEEEYESLGYKIFYSSLERETEGFFTLKIILAKSTFTF